MELYVIRISLKLSAKKVVEKNNGKIAAKDFEDHHKINGGISRYEKFNRLIKNIDATK